MKPPRTTVPSNEPSLLSEGSAAFWSLISDEIANEIDLSRLLPLIIVTARRVTGANYGALGVLDPSGSHIVRFIHDGMNAEDVATIGAHPTGRGLLGEVWKSNGIVVSDHIADHPSSRGFPQGHPPMETFLGVPLRADGKVFGNLYLAEKDGGFTKEDEQTVQYLATQAGTAIHNAQLASALTHAAIQEERRRIARDLHDGVIQLLFSVGMGLDATLPMITTDPETAQERVDGAVVQIDDAIAQLRHTIHQLHHESQPESFTSSLVDLIDEYQKNTNLQPALQIDHGVESLIPADATVDMLFITREALSNVAKHAETDTVMVTLKFGEEVFLSITDQGVGFRPGEVKRGHGLRNMYDRAARINAKLELQTAPASGTTVTVRLPSETMNGVPDGTLPA